ncbi:27432_t:CDS:1, partial [Dentiscutata erythropus]
MPSRNLLSYFELVQYLYIRKAAARQDSHSYKENQYTMGTTTSKKKRDPCIVDTA